MKTYEGAIQGKAIAALPLRVRERDATPTTPVVIRPGENANGAPNASSMLTVPRAANGLEAIRAHVRTLESDLREADFDRRRLRAEIEALQSLRPDPAEPSPRTGPRPLVGVGLLVVGTALGIALGAPFAVLLSAIGTAAAFVLYGAGVSSLGQSARSD